MILTRNFQIKACANGLHGLGVYGSNFSANVSSNANNMVDFWRGVENGITLEFDTFYNDNNTAQHTDNDLTSIIYNENHVNTQHGHIAINVLNDFKDNRANRNVEPDKTTNKHNVKLSLGWNGEVADKTNPYSWNLNNWPTTNLADGLWHRLEVTWAPDLASNTGNLNYTIYKQGHQGSRNISYSDNTTYDGTDVISYDLTIGSPNYSLERVFGISDLNNTVYWGFSGSTGGFLNNQAVQMVQLPISYYEAELRKEDQEGDLITDATFNLEKYDASTGEWNTEQFYNPYTGNWVTNLQTGSQDDYVGIYGRVFQKLGTIKLTQLTEGTYRWKEVAPAEGYQLDQVYYPNENGFEVNYAASQQENAFQYTAKNTKLYQLELTKTDANTGQPLNDVPFIFSKTENGTTYYLRLKNDTTGFEWTQTEGDAKEFLSGKTYRLGQDGLVTEQAGEAGKIVVQYFPDATNLSWKEKAVPFGYNSKGNLTGEFATASDNKYVYTATQTNSRFFQVSLEKKASDTNAALPGATFTLQQKVGENWVDVNYDGKTQFTTDTAGKISIPNLVAGTYRWEEKQAPVGYKITQKYYPSETGFEVAYREGLAIDPVTQNYQFDPTVVSNEPRDFELVLEKRTSTFQQPIQGVEFKLYGQLEGSSFSDERATLQTNAEGKLILNKNQK